MNMEMAKYSREWSRSYVWYNGRCFEVMTYRVVKTLKPRLLTLKAGKLSFGSVEVALSGV